MAGGEVMEETGKLIYYDKQPMACMQTLHDKDRPVLKGF